MTETRKRIEEAAEDFYNNKVCLHEGYTWPQSCPMCQIDFALSQVLEQIRRDGEIAKEKVRDAHNKWLRSVSDGQKDYWSGKRETAKEIAAAILAQIGEP